MTLAAAAFGTQLKIGDGTVGTENFTTILEVTNIAGPELSTDTADATNMQSTGGYKEFIATLHDGGSVTFEGNYVPTNATQGQLKTDHDNGTTRNFQLVLPNGVKTWSFAGIITKLAPSFPVDGKMTFACSIKISGKPITN